MCSHVIYLRNSFFLNHNGDVMVSVLVLSVADCGFEPGRVKPKTIKLVFVVNYAALRRKSKDWLALSQDSVFQWSHMSTRRLLFQ